MKNFILVFLMLFGVFNANAQKKVIDFVDTDVTELSETRAAIYSKYATGKSAGRSISKEDEEVILKINNAIAANPKPNAKIKLLGVPSEYSYESLKTMYNRLNMYFEQRKEFVKFKRALKAYAVQDTTVYMQLEKDLNIGRQRFRLITQDKEDQ